MTVATTSPIGRILIVDDDPIVHALAEAFFVQRGASEIQSAMNGEEAVDILYRHAGEFDFILCDLNMPKLDGVRFLRYLKTCEYRGPLAILSGESEVIVKTAGSLAAAHNLNLIGVLHKPFNWQELDQVIRRFQTRTTESESRKQARVSPGDLGRALEQGEIFLHYQPKVDVASRTLTGVEALARWRHPQFGMVGPDVFIPMAEKFDLIDALTDRVVQFAVDDAKTWRRHRIDLKVALNLSPHLFDCLELPDRMAAHIDDAGLPRSRFLFEVTESKLLNNTINNTEILTRLRLLGFELSIDDFGTGSSNIDSLRQFPFSELKIDKSFVQTALEDDFARTCVETSIRLARNLGLRVVAEGVETAEQWSFITSAGADEVQGYLFAKPMDAASLLTWCQTPAPAVGATA